MLYTLDTELDDDALVIRRYSDSDKSWVYRLKIADAILAQIILRRLNRT